MNTVIPVFFYDLICRIIPGGILMLAIGKMDLVRWATHRADGQLVKGIGLIAVSWVIGLTLDVAGYGLYNIVIKFCADPKSDNEAKDVKVKKVAELFEVFEAKPVLHRLLPINRELALRGLAERVFFRNMVEICVVIVFLGLVNFGLHICDPSCFWLGLRCRDPILAFVGIFVFSLCWNRTNKALANDPLLQETYKEWDNPTSQLMSKPPPQPPPPEPGHGWRY